MRDILVRILNLFHSRSLDARMDEEIAGHIDTETEANIRRGMRPDAARTGLERDHADLGAHGRDPHALAARDGFGQDPLAQPGEHARLGRGQAIAAREVQARAWVRQAWARGRRFAHSSRHFELRAHG